MNRNWSALPLGIGDESELVEPRRARRRVGLLEERHRSPRNSRNRFRPTTPLFWTLFVWLNVTLILS